MGQLASGHIDDRPFARTVYALVARRFDGDLVLDQRGRKYRVAWSGGAVVAADSAAIGDSVGRVAVETRLIDAKQMGDVLRRVSMGGGQSELELVAEVGGLDADAIAGLKRRVLGHRAMRIFALPGASFVLEEPSVLPPDSAQPFDGRWIIYNGVRLHYDETRLSRELEALVGAGAFKLRPEALAVLGSFGFGAGDKPFLAALRDRAHTVAAIEQRLTDPGQRALALSMIYALAAANCLDITATDTDSQPEPPGPERAGATHRLSRREPAPEPAAQSEPLTLSEARAEPERSRREPEPAPPPRPRGKAPPELSRLLSERLALIEEGADHFAMLGVPRTATIAQVQSAYFNLAKQLHPDRLRAFGMNEPRNESVFAVVNQAFAVLSDTDRRAAYDAKLEARESTGLSEREAEAMALAIMRAETAFQRGEMALRHGSFNAAATAFAEARELNPDEAEHHAYYAWARWCTSEDKKAVNKEVKNLLRTAIRLSPKNVAAYFFRGQIAKQSGQLETAEECFRQVLELEPEHREADKELRLLLARSEKKGGLFDRIKGR